MIVLRETGNPACKSSGRMVRGRVQPYERWGLFRGQSSISRGHYTANQELGRVHCYYCKTKALFLVVYEQKGGSGLRRHSLECWKSLSALT